MRNLSYENEFCMQFHFHANQSHFLKNGFALRLALKQRHKGTRKWPIKISLLPPSIPAPLRTHSRRKLLWGKNKLELSMIHMTAFLWGSIGFWLPSTSSKLSEFLVVLVIVGTLYINDSFLCFPSTEYIPFSNKHYPSVLFLSTHIPVSIPTN